MSVASRDCHCQGHPVKHQPKELCQLCSSTDRDQQQQGADEEGTNCWHLLGASGRGLAGGQQEQGDFILGLLESLGRNGSSASLGKDAAHTE